MLNIKNTIPLIVAPEFASLSAFQEWIENLLPGNVFFVHITSSSCTAMGLSAVGRDITIYKYTNNYVLIDSLPYSVGTPRMQMKKQTNWDTSWTSFASGT